MSKNIQEALLDLKARQEAGEKMPCPRCGRDTMKPDLYTNALSRHADGIYVCDDCGTAEAMLDFMRNPLPLECWAQFREGEATADFKAERKILLGHLKGYCAFGSGDKMQAHKEKYTAIRRERRLAEQEAAVLEVMVEEATDNE